MAASPSSLVWSDGRILAAVEMLWSPSDRGALYGDGLFETVLVRGGEAIWLGEHLERFQRSARTLGYPEVDRLVRLGRDAARGLLAASEARRVMRAGNAVLRLTWTRGEGGRGFAPPDPATPSFAAHLFPLGADVARRRRGVRVLVAHGLVAGSLARHKTTSAAVYVEAARLAQEAGVDDALLEDGGRGLTEASSSNLFALLPDGLVTPPATMPLLPGLTRTWVIARTAAPRRGQVRLPRVVERPLGLDDLLSAREAFLTNSVVGVVPLLEVGGSRFGDGRAGIITRELQATLEDEWDRKRPIAMR